MRQAGQASHNYRQRKSKTQALLPLRSDEFGVAKLEEPREVIKANDAIRFRLPPGVSRAAPPETCRWCSSHCPRGINCGQCGRFNA